MFFLCGSCFDVQAVGAIWDMCITCLEGYLCGLWELSVLFP